MYRQASRNLQHAVRCKPRPSYLEGTLESVIDDMKRALLQVDNAKLSPRFRERAAEITIGCARFAARLCLDPP